MLLLFQTNYLLSSWTIHSKGIRNSGLIKIYDWTPAFAEGIGLTLSRWSAPPTDRAILWKGVPGDALKNERAAVSDLPDHCFWSKSHHFGHGSSIGGNHLVLTDMASRGRITKALINRRKDETVNPLIDIGQVSVVNETSRVNPFRHFWAHILHQRVDQPGLATCQDQFNIIFTPRQLARNRLGQAASNFCTVPAWKGRADSAPVERIFLPYCGWLRYHKQSLQIYSRLRNRHARFYLRYN